MPLREEIRVIRDRSLERLSDAHDYFTYSKRVWRTVQRDIKRRNRRFTWRNASTNSSVDEQELLRRAQRYIADELASATLQQFVSIFEGFLFDAMRAWLVAYPGQLSQRQITGKEILRLPDKPAIVEALVERELREVFYDRPGGWFEYLQKLVRMDRPDERDTIRFSEIKATRDILVHGQGVANRYYFEKAKDAARAQPGQPLELPESYHQASWELLCSLVREIGTQMLDKARPHVVIVPSGQTPDVRGV